MTSWLSTIYKRLAFPLEKAMAPHSTTLAWKIPWTEEPGRLQSMGSLRVGHDWATSLSLFTFMHWRRKWHPTPLLLPGKSHGQRSLIGYSPWGHKELDTTERHFHYLLFSECLIFTLLTSMLQYFIIVLSWNILTTNEVDQLFMFVLTLEIVLK